jgi:hypothetical protein
MPASAGWQGDQTGPGPFVLATPQNVRLESGRSLVVTLPCASVDWETYVFATDDSGDNAVHVGVVYPQPLCKPGSPGLDKKITPEDPEYRDIEPFLDAPNFIAMQAQNYVLIGASGVENAAEGLQVTFAAPCQDLDFENVVSTFDDTGDGVLWVGVVYNRSRCRPGPMRPHSLAVEAGSPAYEALQGGQSQVVYRPMAVAASSTAAPGVRCANESWSLTLSPVFGQDYHLQVSLNGRSVVVVVYQFIRSRPAANAAETQIYYTDTTDGGLYVYENNSTGQLRAVFDQIDAYVPSQREPLDFPRCLKQ